MNGDSRPSLSWKKRVVFSLVPVLVLVVAADAAVRILGLDKSLMTLPMDDDERPDVELFWSMSPNAQFLQQDGTEIRTNSLGLRGPEVLPKQSNEIRILSLGESTTFGSCVSYEETYSALLESSIGSLVPDRTCRVINAGVSVYSSFQSLKYLELRGLKLQPDIVLFYHEFNDFLPTSSPRTQTSVLADDGLSDRELYYSREHKFHRTLLSWSAIYRSLTFELMRRRYVENKSDPAYIVPELPGLGPAPRRVRRVPPRDRLLVLGELRRLCDANGVTLVVIHPSYRDSEPHECALTSFCKDTGTLMFDAQESLHPKTGEDIFIDKVHPNAAGHARMAGGLYEFLLENDVIPR